MANESDLEIPLTHFRDVANFKKLVDISVEKGFLVRDGAVAEWSFSGFRYRDGVPCLYGPPAPGDPLSAALERPREEALAAAARLVRALVALAGEEERIEIFPESVRLLENGGVLFLPAEVFRKIRLLADDEYKARRSRLNNPYAEKAGERLSHAVGAVLYRAFTGAYPYDGADLDRIHARIRQRKVVPPHYLSPDLKTSVSDLFCRFFERKLPLTVADWDKALAGWLAEGYTVRRDPAEAAEIEIRRSRLEERLGRGLRRSAFLEKHGKVLLISAAGVVAAAVIASSIVANALKPRLTAGFPPEKVVASYYQAIDALDPELMRDCLKGDAGAGELQRTEIMFVNTRQVMYYTRENDRLSASEWAKLGRPRVSPPSYVDGVAGLVVRRVQDGPEPVYEASYERWLQEPGKSGNANVLYQMGWRVKERLTLAKDDRGWRITMIEQLERKEIYRSDRGYQPPPAAPSIPKDTP